MTNSEINIAIAKALGLSVCEDQDCSGCDAQAFVCLGIAARLGADGQPVALPWATSADSCFRDLIPEAESRGCVWQVQSISGHPGAARAVFLLPESSGLTYNQRIRDAVDLVPRAICLAWLGSKRP